MQSMGVSSRRKQDWSISDQVADGKLKEGRRKIGKHAKEKGPDVWFDDVPLDCVNGELVARAPKKESASSLITGLDKRYIAHTQHTHTHTHTHTHACMTQDIM